MKRLMMILVSITMASLWAGTASADPVVDDPVAVEPAVFVQDQETMEWAASLPKEALYPAPVTQEEFAACLGALAVASERIQARRATLVFPADEPADE